MSRVYPDWVGPTTEYRQASRFPRWIHVIGGVLPSIPEGWLGGVEVLPNTYAAAIVESTFGGLVKTITASVQGLGRYLGVVAKGQPNVEIDDEDAGL